MTIKKKWKEGVQKQVAGDSIWANGGESTRMLEKTGPTVSFMPSIISDKHMIDVMVMYVASKEMKTNADRFMVENPSGKRLLGCHRCEWEGTIATNLKRLRKEGFRLDSSGPRYKPVAGCCDHTNNLQVPQMKKFLDYLRNISFLTMTGSYCC
jgi:hypothetical protein